MHIICHNVTAAHFRSTFVTIAGYGDEVCCRDAFEADGELHYCAVQSREGNAVASASATTSVDVFETFLNFAYKRITNDRGRLHVVVVRA